MAPKYGRRGRKGKKRRRRKKRKPKVEPQPPPLHSLTVLYDELYDATVALYEMRIACRKKRLETWFMMMQISEAKLNNQIFKDYVEGKMNDLQEIIDRLLKLIQDEKDSIAEAIRKLTEEMDKKIKAFNEQSAKLEAELAEVNEALLEFLPLMAELEKLLERLEAIKKEIEAARIEANLKIRHLTNQFLLERGKLHNHLEEQLCLLIRHCRTHLIPIIWTFMQRMQARNACARFKLSRADEKNINLAEKRVDLLRKRKLLMLEKPYWGIEWAIHRMADATYKKKTKKLIAPEEAEIQGLKAALVGKTDDEMDKFAISDGTTAFRPGSAGTILGRDFGKFLIQRLTAVIAAKARAKRSEKMEKKRFMKTVMASTLEDRRQTMAATDIHKFFPDDDEDDYDWNDLEAHYGHVEDSEEEGGWVTSGEEEVVTEPETEKEVEVDLEEVEEEEVEENHDQMLDWMKKE